MIKHYKRLILLYVWIGTCMGRPGVADNMLKDIFLHKGPKSGQTLEVGKLVLYFSERADFTLLPVSQGQSPHKTYKSYFFPQTRVAGADVMQAIKRVGSVQHAWYGVQVAAVQAPVEGVRVTISYDPEKVEVHDQLFDSIQLNKAIEVVFYNKEIKKRLINGVQAPLLRRAANEKKKYGVIVDCGHGGKDTGAIGYAGLPEKKVTLAVGMQLAQILQNRGMAVFLTRNCDETVPIDVRTSFANQMSDQANLLVSIHANMAHRETACGIETFCLERSLFFPLADASDAQFSQCVSRMLEDRFAQSRVLAQCVHDSTCAAAQKRNVPVGERGVKQAVAQILLGAQLPAALIEIGFLSNKREAALLRTKSYQHTLAQGIADGIFAYLQTIS